MEQEERLALAVRAAAAMVRARQAKARAVLLERGSRPIILAMERFRSRYGQAPDLHTDGAAIFDLVAEDVSDLDRETISAAAVGAGSAAQFQLEAAAALKALNAAWTDVHGSTVLEWIGVDAETFERAVAASLAEQESPDRE
jgi:hypothetical protein